YAEAFAKYQLDLDGVDPQEAGSRVRASPICLQLTAALDDWALIGKRRQAPGWQRRLAVARTADPDRWRNRLRDALAGDDRALEEVLKAASPDDWPTATLVLLSNLAGNNERTAALLRRARQRHPGDFWINHQLAVILVASQPPRLAEGIHYLGIAVALRPQSI